MKESDQIDRIAKFLSGNLPEEEHADFLQWLDQEENQALFAETEQVWKLTDEYVEPDFDVDTLKAWNEVDAQLEAPAVVRKLSFPRQLLRIAAVFMVVALATLWYVNREVAPQSHTIATTTSTEETKELLLPDGTQVWLNGSSTLSYDEQFAERRVELSGEAFFDVARMEDQPFEIISGAAKTVVLGTAFNVRAYPGEKEVEVSVVRGKVALTEEARPDKAVVLEAGNAGTYIKAEKTVKKETVTSPNSDSWKTKRLVFDSTEMDEVIESLQRYFRISIEVKNEKILGCHFTGDFREPSLENILKVLEFSANLEATKQNDRYLLIGKGCE